MTSPIIVVDTMVASAWLARKSAARRAKWAPLIEQSAWILPFAVVAEMRFGASLAGWGSQRTRILEELISATQVSPPLQEVIGSYVELRSWATLNGHGLGGKPHEADRWVAAVALAADLPLASDDHIFDGVPSIRLLRP